MDKLENLKRIFNIVVVSRMQQLDVAQATCPLISPLGNHPVVKFEVDATIDSI